MQASVEISLYPLHEDYDPIVVDFLKTLQRKYPKTRIETNGLSTQIFGEYDSLMQMLQVEMKEVLARKQAVFVLKLCAGERSPETVENLLD